MSFVLIYLIILVLLFLFYRLVRYSYLKRLQRIYAALESFFFEFHVFLWQHKNAIYKYEKSLPVLFAHKRKFLKEPQISARVIGVYISSFKEDAAFLDQFVGDDATFSFSLPKVGGYVKTLESTKTTLRRMLAILTLTLSTAFIK